LKAVDENTRRQITWVVIIAVILSITITASYRRGELKRLAGVIADGTPQQRIAAVRLLVKKQKLQEALEDQPRWVMDRAVATIPFVGTDEAHYELLTCHGQMDAPVQARDQVVLSRLGRRGLEVLVEGIQDKDGGIRGTAVAPLTNVGKAIEADKKATANPVIKACVKLLDAWDQYVRDNVTTTLSGIASKRVTDALIPVIEQLEPGKKRLPDGKVRDQTTQEFMRARGTAQAALVATKVPALQPIIDSLVTFADADVRGRACKMMGDIAVQPNALIPVEDLFVVVKPLLGRLDADESFAVRRRAAVALGGLADIAKLHGVVPRLIARLADVDAVKSASAESLGKLADPAAIDPLVTTLITNRHGAVRELRIALTALGEPAVSATTRALSSPEAEVRLIATQAIAQIGGPTAVVPLGSMLKDRDLGVRRVAAAALRDAADQRVLVQVAAALGDEDWQVYHSARDALANVGLPAVPVLVAALANPSPRVTEMALEALVRIGAPALPVLRTTLASPSASQAQWAALAMGGIGYSAVRDGVGVLQDRTKPANARAMAALALGRSGAGDAVMPLISALRSQEPAVRIQAIDALQALGDDRATSALVGALADRTPAVRDEALDVLRDWRTADVAEALAKLADTPTVDVDAKRRAAIVTAELTAVASHELLEQDALASTAQPSTQKVDAKTLEQAAVDPQASPKIRTRAIHALGYAGSEASTQVLSALLKPGDPYAAEAAVAVARVGARTAVKPAAGQRPTATPAAKALIDLMLSSPDLDLRAKCAAGLALMGDQPVTELISRISKVSPDLKPWVSAALGAIGKPATDPLLEIRGASRDPELKRWLVAALSLIGDAQAVELLRHLPETDQPKAEDLGPARQILDRIRADMLK
jgi:HEAT repeat protein